MKNIPIRTMVVALALPVCGLAPALAVAAPPGAAPVQLAQNNQGNNPRGQNNGNRRADPEPGQRRTRPSPGGANQRCADPNNPRRTVPCSEAPSHFRPVGRPPE